MTNARPSKAKRAELPSPASLALILAACQGDVRAAEDALRAGADPLAVSQGGRSALEAACEEGHADVAALLLKSAPIDPSELARAVDKSCRADRPQCLRLLILAGADVDAGAHGGQTTPAVRCAVKNAIGCLRLLAEVGADLDRIESLHGTAAMAAAHEGSEECLAFLIGAGADLEARDEDGSTAAMRAARHGREACLRLLIQAGADIHAPAPDGRTALNEALETGEARCARILLGFGADLERRDSAGRTPLLRAVFHALILISPALDTLLDAGADLDAVDCQGRDAVSILGLRGHDDLADMLREAQSSRRLAGELRSSLPEGAGAKRPKPL